MIGLKTRKGAVPSDLVDDYTEPLVTISLRELDKLRSDIEDLTEVIRLKDTVIERLDAECTTFHRQLQETKEKYAALIESVRRQEACW